VSILQGQSSDGVCFRRAEVSDIGQFPISDSFIHALREAVLDVSSSPTDHSPDGATSASTPRPRSAGDGVTDPGALSAEGLASDPAARLVVAAGPVFARKGFDRATVREIARDAGVNVAAVSYYFGDKMGLYRGVIASIKQKRVREYPTPVTGKESPARTLEHIVRTLLSRMLAGNESGWESQLMMREMMRPTAVLDEMIDQYFRPLYDVLCQTIDSLLPSAESDDGDAIACWRRDALVPQLALSVVGQCLHHMVGRTVIEKMIDVRVREAYFDLDSLCRHVTAVTLAACDDQSMLAHYRRLSGGDAVSAEPTEDGGD